jgi:hypothetical protein
MRDALIAVNPSFTSAGHPIGAGTGGLESFGPENCAVRRPFIYAPIVDLQRPEAAAPLN